MKYFILMFVLMLIGCSASTTKLGYWLDRGSSTFTGIYQCVEPFKPHQNIECE